jgi:uncharacterized BrkB/YihY/UPF0761 family membrane protein
MDWKPFVIGSTCAFGATICFFLLLKFIPHRWHRKADKQLSYEGLRRERDVFSVLLYYSVMWVMWVPPRVDVATWDNWLGVVFAASVLIVRYILLLIDKLFSRHDPISKEVSPAQQ